jgi:cytochrome P450
MNRKAIAVDTVLGARVGSWHASLDQPWIIHRHRKFWDQPTAFMADRFGGKASPWTSGKFLPSGAGPATVCGATAPFVVPRVCRDP